MSAVRSAKSWGISLALACLLIPPTAAFAASDPLRPQSVRDPRYGAVLFDFYQNHYFDAITRIMVTQQRAPIAAQGADPELLLGSLYLSYGMHDAAAAIFQRLLDGATSPYTHDLAWFYLGKLRYQDEQYAAALTAFQAVGDALPAAKNAERLNLIVNTQLRENKFDEAKKTLEQLKHGGIWREYARYNLGTALIRAKRVKEGAELLNQVAVMDARDEERYALRDEERYALRDKANIALGYASLRDKTLSDPVAAFSRVRLSGPFSSPALLGSGWAYSAQDRPQEGLMPWFELAARPADLASQEALVAIAYTLETLGAPELALSYYQNAIAIYDRERATLDTALSSTSFEELLRASVPASAGGDAARLSLAANFPELPAGKYAYDVVASSEFQKAYRDYRDLHFLKAQVARWQERIPLLHTMLEERRRRYALNVTELSASNYQKRLDTIIAQRAALSAEIATIEGEENTAALADVNERESRRQLLEIKSRLDALPASAMDASAQLKKFRILYGMLQWQLKTEFPQRLWRVKAALRALDHDLEHTSAVQSSLEEIVNMTPLNFAGLAQRITELDQYLKNLSGKLDAAIAGREQYCAKLITGALTARKRQVETYRSRALYAQARLYDQLSHEQNVP